MSALINRVQVVNFIRNKYGEKWSPRFREQTYDFEENSSIVQAVNGVGKTTISNAFNALLSRNKELLKMVRRAMAPDKFDAYSHFRVEFISKRFLGLVSTPGETHVFGMYGTQSKGSIQFYHYAGKLEDLPLCERNEHGDLTIYSKKRFNDLISEFPGILKRNQRWDEWRAAIGQMVPNHIVERMARFQLRGGGEDHDNNLFQVKKIRGERLDQTFFWEVLAPEIMANPMGAFAEEDEYHFEDTILQTAGRAVAAQIAAEEEMEGLARQNEALGHLDALVLSGAQVVDSKKRLSGHLDKLRQAMAATRYIVDEALLPGFPRFVSSGENKVDLLVTNMVVDPNLGVLLRDRGLAELLGKEAKHVNRDASSRGINGAVSPQVIEIIVDQKFLKDERGRSPRYYSQKHCLTFLSACTDSYLPAPREELVEIICKAFRHFATKVDSNPFRQFVRRLGNDTAKAEQLLKAEWELADSLRKEVEGLEQGFKEFKENEGLYREMVDSGLFSTAELAEPAGTGKALEDQKQQATAKLEALREKQLRLQPVHTLYERFIAAFPDSSPTQKKDEWRARETYLKAAEAIAAELDRTAHATETTALKALGEAQRKETTAQTHHSRLDELNRDSAPFYEAFPNESPAGFAGRARNEISVSEKGLGDLQGQMKEIKDQVDHLDKWVANHPGETPAEAVARLLTEQQELAESLRLKQAELGTAKQDLAFLSQKKIAPGPDVAEALTAGAVICGFTSLHEAIRSFELSDERRVELFTLFSTVLFAPVVPSLESVSALLELFEERRLSVPVFLKDELESFCIDGELHSEAVNGIVYTYLVGRRSFAVECLLDPGKLAAERERLKRFVASLEIEEAKLKELLREASDDSPALVSARKAKDAVNAKSRFEEMLQAQSRMQKSHDALLEKYTEKVLYASQRAERLETEGGKEALAKAKAALLTAQRQLENAKSDLAAAERERPAASEALRKAKGELETFLEGPSKPFRQDIENLVEHVHKGDHAFMKTAQADAASIRESLDRLEKRLKYRFDRAQSYVSSLDSSEEQRREKIDAKMMDHAKAAKAVIEREEIIRSLSARAGALQGPIVSYDNAVAQMLPAYRALAVLIHDDEMSTLLGPSSGAPDEVAQAQVAQILDGLSDVESCKDEILVALNTLKGHLESELSLKSYDEKARSERRALHSAQQGYVKACGALLQTPPKGLTQGEIEILERFRNDPDGLETFVNGKRQRVEDAEADCIEAQQKEETLYKELLGNLQSLAETSASGLSELKKVLRAHKGATFQIDVELADDFSVVIGKLVQDLRRTQMALKRETGQDLLGDDGPEAAKARKSVRDNLRTELYRNVFRNPRITVDYPHICGDRKRLYNDGFSSGERMALSLLWLTLLAEYSIKMEARINSGGRRKAVKEIGPSVFWIDGLFSNLSSPEMVKTSLQLKESLGRFQLIGLMHNPEALFRHDFDSFPKLFVTMVRNSPDLASPNEWADSKEFHKGEADSIVAFVSGEIPVTQEEDL
ncbi:MULTISPECIES: hypothetical protein [unclassified Pseudodesulfovibrio]|uniref:hypothetical protein n=1 Tax=unclassified Pseudodesulfovibrio TaxID=2661612 RepID=UPI000FEB82AF|nr:MULTISPECIES: hypothetical protein [unclassified Pseudodesulfovibrio]MCJ2163028.1 hypothetical protein [Pseudodesulfovibrio sp. S3-i]RWU07022.1 hypothetical protein DWB63_00505 [Pseudodesulfovibrio sp. S3]